MSSATAKPAPSFSELLSQPARTLSVDSAAITTLERIAPLAESVARACENIEVVLSAPENRLIMNDYIAHVPVCMPSNAGEMVAEGPLSGPSRLFAAQVERCLDQLEHQPELALHQLTNLRMAYLKMLRFVHPPLLAFADHLHHSIIPTLTNSTQFGAPGANQRLLDAAQQIRDEIGALSPMLGELATLCETMNVQLPSSSHKGMAFR